MNDPLLRLLTALLRQPTSDLNRLVLYATGHTLGKNGSFWKGRRPRGGDMTAVISQLVQNDQIGPCLARIVDGQLDRDPDWQAMDGDVTLLSESAAPAEGEEPDPSLRPDPIVDAMTQWHTDANLLAEIRTAAHAYQWAGRAVMRVYVPDAYEADLEERDDWTLAEALELVHVQAVDPRDGGPILDGHGRCLGYFFAYGVRDELTLTTTRYVEVHTPEEVRRYRRVGTASLVPDGEPRPNPMHDPALTGSRRHEYLMLHVDRRGGSALTPSAIDSQDRLNAAETYFGRNDDMGSFRMIVTGNAEDPVTPDGRPTTWKAGPDVVISLVGLPELDVKGGATGKRHTPTFQVIEPLDPSVHNVPSVNHWRRNVLSAFDQEWTLGEDAADASGESKRQSRKAHDKRVVFAAADTARLLVWALRAALKLAASIVGDTELERVSPVRFLARMYLDVDSTNLNEYRAKLDAWRAGGLDLVSLLESTPGVTDVDSAKARTQAEWAERGGPPKVGGAAATATGTGGAG